MHKLLGGAFEGRGPVVRGAGLLLLGICAAASAWGAGITYTEPPDLPDTGGPVLTFAPGVNVISGIASGCSGCATGDFQDNFTIEVPVGFSAINGSVQGSVDLGGGINGVGACFTNEGCFGTGFFSGLNSLTPGFYSRTLTSPYSFDLNGDPLPGTLSWTVTYTLVASTLPDSGVPEPSSMLMLLPAGAGLWLLRRRWHAIVNG